CTEINCCVTFGGGAEKFIFGSGTQLLVEPNIPDSPPSVYLLKSKKEDKERKVVCLITDFSPAKVNASLNKNNVSQKASIIASDRSYGIVSFLNRSPGEKVTCIAEYNSEPTKGSLSDKDEGPDEQCLTADVHFQTDEKMNFLSLTVLGLRIIFLKSILFNLLMTVRITLC
uniref:Immunoglobulin C1-set domain-containing protein n=1 Tax=Latimeria chalumnae TaxID=7897 RepID=M3XJV5_LATCH